MCFPSQERVIDSIVDRVAHHLSAHINPLIIFGSYTIGKERVFLEVQRRCGGFIYASARKRHIFSLLGLDMGVFTSDVNAARYRVCGMGDVSFRKVEALSVSLQHTHDAFVAIAPSGWEWQRVTKKRAHEQPFTYRTWQTVHCYGFPYSEHSSFEELVAFVAWLRPQRIVPTVFTAQGRTSEAINKQLVPFHKYIALEGNKATLFGFGFKRKE